MDKPKLVYCAWLDIENNCDPVWIELPETSTPSPCFSVGWLIADEPDHITITATYSDEHDDSKRCALMTTTIPRGCITKLQELSFPILETPVA